ncbi:hypothetical protein tpqmel_0473 [Candidatus Gastranaerophilus sp. (ex Termes propinquus)]|nr:hypothetical protein tpqmel_0473 [Candidatus Gastranaerophilus sp. (ex Termes propinquus)]
MENFSGNRRLNEPKDDSGNGVSFYSRSVSLLDADPLEEIFALNLGDFLTEHLINPELAYKIGTKARDKNDSLKSQLRELVSIYSINNTLALLGFDCNEGEIIYSSIAKTMADMLTLDEFNIYSEKFDEPLKLSGTSKEKSANKTVPEYVVKCKKSKTAKELKKGDKQINVFPMKNNFECIGTFEIVRTQEKPLEEEFCTLLEITASLFVTSLGLQKLITSANNVLGSKIVSTSELQNLRAQLTAIIGDLGDGQQAFAEALASAVDLKAGHQKDRSKHAAGLSRELCKTIGLNEKTTDLIYYAGLLQNIGKITLSAETLNKKEKLTNAEWEKLQNTPDAGVSLLMNINFLSEVVPYVHYQKERYDGSGTPEGLKGFSIPFGSRIIALADAYCALTEDRPHRASLTNTEALEIIGQESAIKWDPVVVEALLKLKK